MATDRKWWVLLAIGVGAFMSAFNGSVVNAILPLIQQSFGSDVAGIEWVVTSYLLVASGLLLSFGRLGDLRGYKRIYVAGFAVFVIGSTLCGLAPTAGTLVGFRVVQALGGAMLFASSPAILTGNFPPAQRGQVLGLQATMTYLGLTAGPSAGGWLAGRFSWPAVFYLNVPVGLLALLLSLRFIPDDPPARRAERFDWAGALTFVIGLMALLLALNQGHAWGWTSLPTLVLLAGAVAVLGLFLWLEGRVASPMLDLTLFRRRLFTTAAASAVLNYVCLYSIMFLVPFYLIRGRGLSPAQAGLILTAQPLVMAVAAPLSGTLSDRIGSRLLSTVGMAVLAVALFLLARLGPGAPLSQVAAGLAVAGLGTGIFISPNTSALMGAAPRDRQGIASGVMATARNVGMALGVGLAGAILTTVLTQGQLHAAGASFLDSASAPLFDGVGAGLAVASGIAIVGAVTSAGRGT
jgi:EmrB/QacA subfamily drug resistance transporter